MSIQVLTFSLRGLDVLPVRVEVHLNAGRPFFDLSGLPEASVRETRVRVRAALLRVGVELDELRITVCLVPADAPKSGGGFDLAIAVGVLAALGKIPAETLTGTAVLGELSLTGEIKQVRGVLPAVLAASKMDCKRLIVPLANIAEAAHVEGIDTRAAKQLTEIIANFTGERPLHTLVTPEVEMRAVPSDVDFADVRGQYAARRALEVAAAGGHNLLFIGAPGCGKTMMARRLATILPPLSMEEALETTTVHSIAGTVPASGLVTTRPFRAPHHTVSPAGLVGGGDPVRPGEVSLAHHGVLFLDEVPDLRREALEALRQPLQEGIVTIFRARERLTFPAKPLFVAAMSPCPCGFLGEPSRACGCTPERVQAYRARLKGPLLDRIDLQVTLRQMTHVDLVTTPPGEASKDVRARVIAAREVQSGRVRNQEVKAHVNAALTPREFDHVAALDTAGTELLAAAEKRLGLSERAQKKVLRVARTIADLDGSVPVKVPHVAEAVALVVPSFVAIPPQQSLPGERPRKRRRK